MKLPSKRFNPTKWTERLVPVVLFLLLLGLVTSLFLVILSILGLTPGM